MTKTGMKAPQGTGIVVASADIQNCRWKAVQTGRGATRLLVAPSSTPRTLHCLSGKCRFTSYPRFPRDEGFQNQRAWV